MCPLEVDTDGGAGYKATPLQKAGYYRAWLPMIDKIVALPEFGLVLNGDIVDLDVKRRGAPLISQNPKDILEVAAELFAPLVRAAKWIIITRGTSAHVGVEACHEEQLAGMLDRSYPGKIIPYAKRTLTHDHAMLNIDGLKADIAHHPEVGIGRAQTTQATYPIRIAVAVRNRYIDGGEKPPDLVIRGHFHAPADGEYKGIRVIGLPGWQWPTSFVYRLGGADILASFGGLIGSDLDVYKLRRTKAWLKL